ncbi:MAG TPA: hypothetical protein VLE72_01610 [Candidatus Saccharimonadales bacterium]|nr:hypothetical protein [Candidatus Saccharimonadales bacterium]
MKVLLIAFGIAFALLMAAPAWAESAPPIGDPPPTTTVVVADPPSAFGLQDCHGTMIPATDPCLTMGHNAPAPALPFTGTGYQLAVMTLIAVIMLLVGICLFVPARKPPSV